MRPVTLTVLDESGEALAPPAQVSGRLTVAQQPRPWEAPVLLAGGEYPSHLLRLTNGAEGMEPLRYVEHEDGRRWRILGREAITAGLGRGEVWRLRLEGQW